MKILLALTLALFFTSCASKPEAEKEEPEKKIGPKQQFVGRIASVSKAGKFVLIQKFGAGALPKDVIFQSRGNDGRTAALRPSGERIRDFFAADLLSGTVEKGDAVVAYPNPVEPDEEDDTEDDSPEDSESAPETEEE